MSSGHGFIPSAIWTIRETTIETLLALPAFSQELALAKQVREASTFRGWVEQVVRQGEE